MGIETRASIRRRIDANNGASAFDLSAILDSFVHRTEDLSKGQVLVGGSSSGSASTGSSATTVINNYIGPLTAPLNYTGDFTAGFTDYSLVSKLWTINQIAASTPNSISIVAAQTILPYTVVTADGYIADSTNNAHYGKVIGICIAGGAIGTSIQVQFSGKVTKPSWGLSIGPAMLNGTSIGVRASFTGFAQRLGNTIATDTIVLGLQCLATKN